MITELRAHNFKSWQATGEIQFAPLTGFFGANNSGKTSILQLLLLLKQTTEDQSEPNVPLLFGNDSSPVNLVDFDTVIHRHNNSILHILLWWELPEKIEFRGTPVNFLSFSTEIHKRYDETMLDNFRYTAGEHDVGIEWRGGYQFIDGHGTPNPLRCYGLLRQGSLRKIICLFRKPLKTYSLESTILVHDARIPDTIIIGARAIQEMSDIMERRRFPYCFRVWFKTAPLVSKS